MLYVCNSTPLIAFAKIGHLDLISKAIGTIVIPEAVYKELTIYEE